MSARQINIGYLLAVANIVHLHDEPTIAVDVLRELGVSLKDVSAMGLADYDMDVLRKLFEEMERRDVA